MRALRTSSLERGARVLDLCAGTGVVGLAAARAGAHVTAVDISRRAVAAAKANAALHRLPLRVLRGDLLEPVRGERFDMVLVNPPYVICDSAAPRNGRARTWAAGADGRMVVDTVCGSVAGFLEPGGSLLMVHSALCRTERSLEMLRDCGLKAAVVGRASEPFGPVMRSHAAALRARGLIGPGRTVEELVVIRADRPDL